MPPPALPHDLNAEQSLLGSILIDTSALAALNGFSSDSFYDPKHKVIYDAVEALITSNSPVDGLTIRAHLEERGLIGAAGGVEHLVDIMRRAKESEYSGVNVSYYADIVLEHARKRAVILACADAQEAIEGKKSPQEVAETLLAAIHEVNAESPEAIPPPAKTFTTLRQMTDNPPMKPESLLGDGILIPGGFMVISGKPGLGKSFLAFDLALSAACGRPWCGISVFTTQKCRTAVITMELPEFYCYERLNSIRQDRQFSLEDVENTYILASPFQHWVCLSTQKGKKFIQDAIKALKLDLLVLDPLSRLHTADENDAAKMGEVMGAIDNIRKTTGCAFVLVHHETKASVDSDSDDLYAARGSGRIVSDAQTVLRIKEKQGALGLFCGKINLGPPVEDIWLEQLPSGSIVEGDPPEDKSASKAKRKQALLDVIKAAGPEGISLSTIKDLPPGSPASILSDVSEGTLRSYCRDFASDEMVTKLGTTKKSRWAFVDASL